MNGLEKRYTALGWQQNIVQFAVNRGISMRTIATHARVNVELVIALNRGFAPVNISDDQIMNIMLAAQKLIRKKLRLS